MIYGKWYFPFPAKEQKKTSPNTFGDVFNKTCSPNRPLILFYQNNLFHDHVVSKAVDGEGGGALGGASQHDHYLLLRTIEPLFGRYGLDVDGLAEKSGPVFNSVVDPEILEGRVGVAIGPGTAFMWRAPYHQQLGLLQELLHAEGVGYAGGDILTI